MTRRASRSHWLPNRRSPGRRPDSAE
jgi:hypothetical protein